MVSEALRGTLLSTLLCTACGSESRQSERFYSVSLSATTGSLDDALQAFTSPETIPNVRCANCDENQVAVRTYAFESLPEVFVVHFKRFRADPTTGGFKKDESSVDFPTFELGALETATTSVKARRKRSRRASYVLSTVVEHKGDMSSGHYVAHARACGNWYTCDDERVLPRLSVDDVSPYMLFYVRK